MPPPGGNPLSNYPSRQTVGNDTGSSNDTGGKERVSVVFSLNEIGGEALRAFDVRGDVMCACVLARDSIYVHVRVHARVGVVLSASPPLENDLWSH